MALEPGRGGSNTAVRSSLAAVTLGVATLVAAITFGAGLTHLLTTPALYGKSWNVALTTYDAARSRSTACPCSRRTSGSRASRSAASRAAFGINGLRVDGLAVDTVSGEPRPVILEGRRPRGNDEIALGTRTMRALGLHIGDVVTAAPFSSDRKGVEDAHRRRAVFPLFGDARPPR